MKESRIKDMLYANFLKWKATSLWYTDKDKPTEKEVKRYLGYFGINRRWYKMIYDPKVSYEIMNRNKGKEGDMPELREYLDKCTR